MSWSEIEFQELYAVPSKNGLTRPARVRGSGYKMINMGELFANDRIGDIDMELVPMNDKEIATMLVEPGDLLFARQSLVLAGAGRCSIIAKVDEPTTFESHIIRVRLKRKNANPVFFYYYFKSPICRIRSIVIQGVQAGIRGNDLKKLKVHVPSISEQQHIASILSAYDDLIENNRRRIQLLEESARLLYGEWFVCLRFPGYEHVKIKDGVPEGWEKKPFSELATFLNGFAFKPAHLGNVGLPIVKIPELRDGPTVKTPMNTGEHIPKKYLLDNGDILFSWSGTLLVNIWNHGKGLLNQHLFKVTPVSTNLRGLVYFALKHALVEFQNQTTGVTMKHIRKGALEKVASLIPNTIFLDEFEATVTPMLEQISVLQRQTTEAVKARDLLLPRLMNGELEV